MGRLMLCSIGALALGCSGGVWLDEDGFQVTLADPSVELGSLPRRCFDGAHTIVVGPGPGCATLDIAASVVDPPPICAGPPPQVGSPVRVASRGGLPVIVEVHQADGFHALGEPAGAGVFVTSGPRGECCPDAWPLGTAGTVRIPFAENASDGTLEMIVSTWNEVARVRACALELTAGRARYRDACAAACEEDRACGWIVDAAECLRECEAELALPEPCLEARMDLRACAVDAASCTRVAEREACPTEVVRLEYECAP